MGYYTLHKISIINEKYNNSSNLEKLKEVIIEVTDYYFRIEYDSYIIDDNYNCGYGSKWYTFHDDIYEISARLPKLKILVEAKEENGDTWEKIVKGGFDSYIGSYSDEDSSDDDEENENEDEEIEDNEDIENEDNDNNYIDDIVLEEEFRDIKINDNLIFQR